MTRIARIDVVPLKHIVIACSLSLLCIVVGIILGQLGPQSESCNSLSSYNCSNGEHYHYDPLKCNGIQMGKGSWSTTMYLQLQDINKYWYCLVDSYVVGEGITGNVLAYVLVKRSTGDGDWQLAFNNSETIYAECKTDKCPPLVLFVDDAAKFPIYSIKVYFETSDHGFIPNLADVVFQLCFDNPEASKMVLIMKGIALVINLMVFAYQYFAIKDIKLHWSEEQRLFLFLSVALIGANNPFFAMEYMFKGWFFLFLGSFLQLIFLCTLIIFWFIITRKLSSPNGTVTLDIYLQTIFSMLAIYAGVSIAQFVLVSVKVTDPLYKEITSIKVVFYVSSAIFVCMIAFLLVTMVLVVRRIRTMGPIRVRFLFFIIPTMFFIISMFVFLALGNSDDVRPNTPTFTYLCFLFNTYFYLMLWGYWPVDVSYADLQPNESSKIFAEAVPPPDSD